MLWSPPEWVEILSAWGLHFDAKGKLVVSSEKVLIEKLAHVLDESALIVILQQLNGQNLLMMIKAQERLSKNDEIRKRLASLIVNLITDRPGLYLRRCRPSISPPGRPSSQLGTSAEPASASRAVRR